MQPININPATLSKPAYQPGESVYEGCGTSGRFLGYFVNELTDRLDPQDALNRLTSGKPAGQYNKHWLVPTNYYSLRQVFSYRWGSVKQALIRDFDGAATWINVNHDMLTRTQPALQA